MKEFESAVMSALAKMQESGALQQIVEDKVAKTLKECVENILGSYSDFGKGLNEHIKTALKIDFKDLGLVGYNEIVLKVIKAKLEKSINTSGTQRLEKELSELLVDPPAEVKLSDLIQEFKEYLGRRQHEGSEITCIIDTSSYGLTRDYTHIYIDEDADTSKYACDIQLDVTPSGEVYGLKISGQDIKNTLFVGPHFGFERQLFQLYAAGTKLIVDADEVYTRCDDFED